MWFGTHAHWSQSVALLTGDRGANRPSPSQAKFKKSGPHIAYMSVLSVLLVFSRMTLFCVFRKIYE